MMNVKKYRAATTREALQQVKQDLGEEAFVLETRQVRNGGFLGFKSGTQIEISAALPPALSATGKTAGRKTAAAEKVLERRLDLTDDAPAAPQTAENLENEKKNILSALDSRASLSDKFENSVSFASRFSQGKRRHVIEAIEISEEAPRFVHAKKDAARKVLPKQQQQQEELALAEAETTGGVENPAAAMFVSSREFELLRAELREVKFSLNAYASRRNAPAYGESVSLEDFGEVFDSPFYDAYLELAATGMSPEFARQIVSKIIPYYKKGFVPAENLSRHALIQALSSRLKFESNPLEGEKPVVMALIGATGVGKTTTIAKLAARVALQDRRPLELITIDTYRIAAVEQLKTYAEIIGANCRVVRSALELEAVLQRVSPEARVLIDTTGRNPHDLADQYEFSEYLRHRPEIRKCLAIQATTHPQDAVPVIKKFELYGADCAVLTKLDETTRPGALIETVAESGLPLIYLCAGQRVPEDLQTATPDNLAAQALRSMDKAHA